MCNSFKSSTNLLQVINTINIKFTTPWNTCKCTTKCCVLGANNIHERYAVVYKLPHPIVIDLGKILRDERANRRADIDGLVFDDELWNILCNNILVHVCEHLFVKYLYL